MTAGTETQTRTASATVHHLEPRKVKFDWAKTPLHWIPNDPFSSHFINLLHIILPAGEFWFCRLYNQAMPLIEDDKLREDIQNFVRQESMHARAHESAIKEYLGGHNIETQTYTDSVDWFFKELLGDKPLGRQLPGFLTRWWLRFRLGIIAAIEHFTCVLGKYALNNRTWDRDGADPVMLDILRWHGAEEVEHRCVAFDLHRHLGGRYFGRYGLMALVIVILFYLWAKGATHMMRQDPALRDHKPSQWRPWFWREWRRIADTTGHLPRLSWLLSEARRYLNPGYHPIYEASTEQALDYLKSSPSARAYSSAPMTSS